MFDLDRFKRAQERPFDGFATALSELRAGRKSSHWIWYIFPQLAGLGRSPAAMHYGLHGIEEATAYLRDPVLRQRLLAVTNAVVTELQRRPGLSLDDLMGSTVDALKLVSSMTLFRGVARRLNEVAPVPDHVALIDMAEAILTVAAAQGFAECAPTLRQVAASGTGFNV